MAKQNKTADFDFNEPIISTASSPIPTRVLLERLDALRAKLDQLENPHVETLESIKDDLINNKLLKNTKTGIQPRLAYCLVKILHHYVPNAPYDASQISTIFKLFIERFKKLKDSDSAFYDLDVHLLKTAASDDIFALMAELPDCSKLIDSLFVTFYELISEKTFDTSLQNYVIAILNVVISEPNVELSSESLKLVMNKFLANTKALKGEIDHICGFDVTQKLCEKNASKLSLPVTQMLSDLLYEAAKDSDLDNLSDSYEDMEQPAKLTKKAHDQKQKQLNKIHTLIVELWRYCPEILNSAMGLLDSELEADDISIRSTATNAVGHILAITPFSTNFVMAHPNTYAHWLKKPLDISNIVRKAWVSQISKIITSRSDIKEDLTNGLVKTLVDVDEKVRLITIQELGALEPSVLLNEVFSEPLMLIMKQLIREKNYSIRFSALRLLSTLYNTSIDLCDTNNLKFVEWIPNDILNLVYINDLTITSEVDLIMFDKIIPFTANTSERCLRLLRVVSVISDKARAAFFAIISRQHQLHTVLTQLLSLIEEHNYDFEDSALNYKTNKAIEWISNKFPPKLNFRQCFESFLKLKNKRFFRLLTLCITPNSDYETVTGSLKELLSKISDIKDINSNKEADFDFSQMHQCMKLLLMRSSSIWYNITNVEQFIDISKDTTSEYNSTSLLILENISKVQPSLLRSNIKLLIETVTDTEMPNKDRWRDLKAIENFASQFPDIFYKKMCTEDEFYNKLREISISGTPIEAPYAIKILSGLKNSDKTLHFHNIMRTIWPPALESDMLNTHLATIGELFICDFDTVENETTEIGQFLTNTILFKNHSLEEDNREWVTEEELYSTETECLTKILAIRVFTKWLIAVEMADDDSPDRMGKHIINTFLSSIIIRGGEIVKEQNTPKRVAARLRLEACLQLLKLAEHARFNELINEPILQRLISGIQDSNTNVRMEFMEQLRVLLSADKISEKFLSLTFFVAHEPQRELKENMKIWIKASHNKQLSKKRNDLKFEKAWVRFLHMLHNHFEVVSLYDEWSESCLAVTEAKMKQADQDDVTESESSNSSEFIEVKEENLRIIKEFITFTTTFIVFVLNAIGSNENISMLYYLSQRLKQSFDATIDESNGQIANNIDFVTNKRLYFISDLTQLIITEVSKARNWNLSVFQGKLGLSRDLFGSLKGDDSFEVVRRDYLSKEDANTASTIIRSLWRAECSVKPRKTQTLNKASVDDAQTINRSKARKRAARVSSDDETAVNSDESEYQDHSSKGKVAAKASRKSKRAKRVNYEE
ncbi:Pds5 protein [Martiniozyma asiatica (nom. inval.)]|nr:Pds5 protein [Martiniozyma asiatica]